MHFRSAWPIFLLVGCGTAPAADSAHHVSADSGIDSRAQDPDVAEICEAQPAFPVGVSPVILPGVESYGVILFDLVPLEVGLAVVTQRAASEDQPGGHLLTVTPEGVQADHWISPSVQWRAQCAAIDDDLLLAWIDSDGQLTIERRTAELDPVWALSNVSRGGSLLDLLGGDAPAVVYTSESQETTEYLRFTPSGELGPESFRPSLGPLEGASLSAGADRVAAATVGAGRTEFWLFGDGAPSLLHLLSESGVNWTPEIAWTGNEWAIGYGERDSAGSSFGVFVSFVSADGTTVTERLMVSEPGQHAVFPTLAAHPTGVTVVWQTNQPHGLLSRTIDANHEMTEPVPVAETDTLGAMLPKITWTGSRLAVAWVSYTRELGYRGHVAFGVPSCP